MKYQKCVEWQSLKDTNLFAKQIAATLVPDSVLLLNGELGAGKTTLTKAIGAELGVPPEVITSPTYTMVNIYQGRHFPIYHVDLYRLNSEEELDDFDPDDLLCSEGVTLIEWPRWIDTLLSDQSVLRLDIEATSEDRRQVTLSTQADTFQSLFETHT